QRRRRTISLENSVVLLCDRLLRPCHCGEDYEEADQCAAYHCRIILSISPLLRISFSKIAKQGHLQDFLPRRIPAARPSYLVYLIHSLTFYSSNDRTVTPKTSKTSLSEDLEPKS